MSSRINYKRPSLQTAGRLTETVRGDALPDELRSPPRLLEPVAARRDRADRAVADFLAAGRKITRAEPAPPGASAPRPAIRKSVSVTRPKPTEDPPW